MSTHLPTLHQSPLPVLSACGLHSKSSQVSFIHIAQNHIFCSDDSNEEKLSRKPLTGEGRELDSPPRTYGRAIYVMYRINQQKPTKYQHFMTGIQILPTAKQM